MAKTYKGTLEMTWHNKQKSILLRDEMGIRKSTDIEAPKINWVNKDDALFYELNEEEGKGIKPYWVDRNDIRVKESRPLIFQKGYRAVEIPKLGTLTEKEWKIEEIEEDTNNIENMLIKGDNLLALNTLKKIFDNKPDNEKVKCIYIDPPYNTGSAFKNYDDNLEFSEWLTMMRDRIIVLRNILKEDGIIYVQVDDRCQAYLQILMDEIFGKCNFVCNFIWESRSGQGNTTGFISEGHEYILCYAKNKEKSSLKQIETKQESGNYLDVKGAYKREQLRQWGEQAEKREDRPSMFFPIIYDAQNKKVILMTDEENSKIYNNKIFNDEFLYQKKTEYEEMGYIFILPIKETIYKRWRAGLNAVRDLILNENIDIDKDKSGEWSVYKKIRDDKISYYSYSTLLFGLGTASTGTNELKKYFGEKIFDTPKPEALINHLIFLATEENDFVLDCFGGSGTTASVASKMKRKWILVDIGESIEKVAKAKIIKTIAGNNSFFEIHSSNYQGGGSFKYYHLGPSIISEKDFNWSLGKTFIEESFLSSYDYLKDTSINWNEGQLFNEEDIPTVGVQKIGNKMMIAVVSLNPPENPKIMIKQEEIREIYKKVKEKYNPEYINIFTNKGVEIAYDDKPEDMEIIKIPQAIFAELEK